MRFFVIDEATRRVVPSPEILLIHPFDVIWKRAEGTERATKEIAFVAFMENLEDDNPFRDEEESVKERKVKKAVFGDDPFETDPIIDHAREVLKSRYEATFSYSYYNAAVEAALSLRDYMRTVDFSERTKSEAMVHDPNKTQNTIAQTIKTLQNLKELRKRVITESYEESKQQKDRQSSMFED